MTSSISDTHMIFLKRYVFGRKTALEKTDACKLGSQLKCWFFPLKKEILS